MILVCGRRQIWLEYAWPQTALGFWGPQRQYVPFSHGTAQCTFIYWDILYEVNSQNKPQHNKTNKVTVRPAKTPISLAIRPVWAESSLCVQIVVKDPSFPHADSEDSDQTGRMPRLIWVFTERTAFLLVLSCRSLNVLLFTGAYFMKSIHKMSNRLQKRYSRQIRTGDSAHTACLHSLVREFIHSG